jgi:hypothetical protein
MNDIEIFENTGLDKKHLDKIISRLPEYYRGSTLIGNSTSQSSYSLQTMQMISDSPFSRLKQCLAQIDKRMNALRESHFKVENLKLEIIQLRENTDVKSRLAVNEKSALVEVIQKKSAQAFRRMGMFQDMYDSIIKNNNIPKDWTEKDFESQEVSNMIRSSFRISIQDLTANGRCSKAAVEFWEQLGIHPQLAEQKTRTYMLQTQEIINQGIEITIQLMYDFLDDMVKMFGNSYKLSLKRIGLDTIGSEGFMAEGATKPQ